MLTKVGTLTGLGDLLEGDEHVAKAHYSITIWQERIDTSTLEKRSSIPGVKSATGGITVTTGASFLMVGDTFKLRLSDGKVCNVYIKSTTVGSGRYELAFSNLDGLI
jgi:uncharacterized protein YxjI